jgi:hypothetical protein
MLSINTKALSQAPTILPTMANITPVLLSPTQFSSSKLSGEVTAPEAKVASDPGNFNIYALLVPSQSSQIPVPFSNARSITL